MDNVKCRCCQMAAEHAEAKKKWTARLEALRSEIRQLNSEKCTQAGRLEQWTALANRNAEELRQLRYNLKKAMDYYG